MVVGKCPSCVGSAAPRRPRPRYLRCWSPRSSRAGRASSGWRRSQRERRFANSSWSRPLSSRTISTSSARRAREVDRAAEAVAHDQREEPAVVEVGVGDQDRVELRRRRSPSGTRFRIDLVRAALEHPAVDQDLGAFGGQEEAGARDGRRAAEEGELHATGRERDELDQQSPCALAWGYRTAVATDVATGRRRACSRWRSGVSPIDGRAPAARRRAAPRRRAAATPAVPTMHPRSKPGSPALATDRRPASRPVEAAIQVRRPRRGRGAAVVGEPPRDLGQRLRVARTGRRRSARRPRRPDRPRSRRSASGRP